MKLFVIHKSEDRKKSKKKLAEISKALDLKFELIYLTNTNDQNWKEAAELAIANAEAVVIFNQYSGIDSENVLWEIDKAQALGIESLIINENTNNITSINRIKSLYNYTDEFGECFNQVDISIIELYKLMINSSESLIKRRQTTNAFFITVIGSLLAFISLIIKSIELNNGSINLLYIFSITGILLCISWGNLIDNYGKLNKAKFDVILRLEEQLSAQIYSAEWISLGKGNRPNKYKSFTQTEKNVPLYFGLLISALTFVAIIYQIWFI